MQTPLVLYGHPTRVGEHYTPMHLLKCSLVYQAFPSIILLKGVIVRLESEKGSFVIA